MTLTTTNKRKLKLLSRGGIDPLRLDKRPLSELLNDEIPYKRFEREAKIIKRAGYRSRNHWWKLRTRK